MKIFLMDKEAEPRGNVQSELMELIKESETDQHHWKSISAEWEPEESEVLFDMITSLWLTARGFSYLC